MNDNQREETKQPIKLSRKSSKLSTQTPSIKDGETVIRTERFLTTRDEPKISQRQEFLAMRTVAVILVNGNRRIK